MLGGRTSRCIVTHISKYHFQMYFRKTFFSSLGCRTETSIGKETAVYLCLYAKKAKKLGNLSVARAFTRAHKQTPPVPSSFFFLRSPFFSLFRTFAICWSSGVRERLSWTACADSFGVKFQAPGAMVVPTATATSRVHRQQEIVDGHEKRRCDDRPYPRLQEGRDKG